MLDTEIRVGMSLLVIQNYAQTGSRKRIAENGRKSFPAPPEAARTEPHAAHDAQEPSPATETKTQPARNPWHRTRSEASRRKQSASRG